jgi:methionyl-tRNA formyltransferase
MKVTIFTSNQPRHLSLIEEMSTIADVVYVVQEVNTVFPGRFADFYKKSEVMQKYFAEVIKAEKIVFQKIRFLPSNVKLLSLKMGDLSAIELDDISSALSSDHYIVFGSSFIKGPLCDFLVSKGALNIHMGVSPYYRGTACNFWALYEKRPEFVGATIHYLSKGLDSGPMLLHAFPKPQQVDGFVLGMLAVRAAQKALLQFLTTSNQMAFDGIVQDKGKQFKYSKNSDFCDEVAKEYLENLVSKTFIFDRLKNRDTSIFLRPYIDEFSASTTQTPAQSEL